MVCVLKLKIASSLIWSTNVDRFDNHRTNLSDFSKSDETVSVWLVFLKMGFTPDFLKT